MELVYSQGEITTRDKNFNILGPAVLPKFTTQLLSKAFRRCVFFSETGRGFLDLK